MLANSSHFYLDLKERAKNKIEESGGRVVLRACGKSTEFENNCAAQRIIMYTDVRACVSTYSRTLYYGAYRMTGKISSATKSML